VQFKQKKNSNLRKHYWITKMMYILCTRTGKLYTLTKAVYKSRAKTASNYLRCPESGRAPILSTFENTQTDKLYFVYKIFNKNVNLRYLDDAADGLLIKVTGPQVVGRAFKN